MLKGIDAEHIVDVAGNALALHELVTKNSPSPDGAWTPVLTLPQIKEYMSAFRTAEVAIFDLGCGLQTRGAKASTIALQAVLKSARELLDKISSSKLEANALDLETDDELLSLKMTAG